MTPDPSTAGDKWARFAEYLRDVGGSGVTGEAEALQRLAEAAAKLTTGQRLVLFVEYRRVPEDANGDAVGLTAEVCKILNRLPERLGIVMSGLAPTTISDTPELAVTEWLALPPDPATRRAQAPTNDLPRGPDRLGIATEVNAIAEAVALKDLEPPMVVGVTGGWGTGKSFVLHLIEKRIQEIRCEPIPDQAAAEDFPFVGHPYLIRFDAWTYAKGNLWASLMQKIFVDLDRQIAVEQALLGIDELSAESHSEIWRLLSSLSDEEHERLTRTELGRKALAMAAGYERGALTASHLWDWLEQVHQNEIKQLAVKETELAAARLDRSRAQAEFESVVDAAVERDARRAAWKATADAAMWEALGLAGGPRTRHRPSPRSRRSCAGFP